MSGALEAMEQERADALAGHLPCEYAERTTWQGEQWVCGCGVILPTAEQGDEPPDFHAEGQQLVERSKVMESVAATLPQLDPTRPHGPEEFERRILETSNRIENGMDSEAALVAAVEERQHVYDMAYARAYAKTSGTVEARKTQAMVMCEAEWHELKQAKVAMKAMKAVMHNLRAVLSGYQSATKSAGAVYGAQRN